MLIPDKFTPYSGSVLEKAVRIAGIMEDGDTLRGLFQRSTLGLMDVESFILAIDLLYLTGVIELNLTNGVLTRAR